VTLDDDHEPVPVTLDLTVAGGTPLGGRCLLPFTWRGEVRLIETAYLGDTPGALAFRVTDSHLQPGGDGLRSNAPAQLWDWLKQLIHPRIEAFTVDLSPLLTGAADLLEAALRSRPDSAAQVLPTLALHDPIGRETGLEINLGFVLPELAPAERAAPPTAPLGAAELARWEAHWQAYDAFVTWAIKHFAHDYPGPLRQEFMTALTTARYRLRDALDTEHPGPDPVRDLFHHTWANLTPLIARAAANSSSGRALRFLAFVNAGDALSALDAVGQQYGIRIDQYGLRELARALEPDVAAVELAYSLAPDPELRVLYGFSAEFPQAPATAERAWYDWFVATAEAAAIDPTLSAELDGWVPRRDDLDRFLTRMDALFEAVIAAETAGGKVASPFLPVYRTLIRATAWQESCWRQFVERGGEVQAIRSPAGSVGLMQINRHVWRGVYDPATLEADVAYNARAGSEILVHYLVDYAVRGKEHEREGGIDNLARATYAVYNGGPGHLQRYRDPDSRPGLQALDQAFWKKYLAIRSMGSDAVRQCYGE
ncbi:MAG: lytic transglycosylase domain-containing protein, partial [Gammaproteobacteria bacterium]